MWKSILVIKIENYWKFTPEIEGKFFRLRHIDPPKAPMGWIGQAESIINTNFHQFFQLQRLNGLSVYEVIEYQKPSIFTTRKLGCRQQTQTPNNWLIEVEVNLMPVVDLNPEQPPINPAISTSKKATTVTMNGTTPVLLLPANTTNSRKSATFYNPSALLNLIIDTDSTINVASGVARVAPGKLYIADIEGWQGEYWGVLDGTGTPVIVVEEYV